MGWLIAIGVLQLVLLCYIAYRLDHLVTFNQMAVLLQTVVNAMRALKGG